MERYAQALKSRNGALARAYLAAAIKDQIPPQVIGVSTPIGKVEIDEKGFLPDKSPSFQLKAFYAPYGSNPPSLAFAQMLAVASESGGRYVIKDIIILDDNTHGAFWEQPREVTPALPEGTTVSRWARLDADGDGKENEIYLIYGNGGGYEGTGQYAVWRADRLHPLGGEVALGNQTFTPPLTEMVRDINGDGRPEIEWSDWGADAGEMKIYAWDGQQFATLFETSANRIELVDLEEDGVLEIAVGNRPQALAEPLYKLYRWQDGRYAELPRIFRWQEGRYVPAD
ncbi:MAG: VCBS repeat-containing protein [Clostridia bacterium]|nr:MAG: VCBS repeat-containing protein [Clostridia bacterium]